MCMCVCGVVIPLVPLLFGESESPQTRVSTKEERGEQQQKEQEKGTRKGGEGRCYNRLAGVMFVCMGVVLVLFRRCRVLPVSPVTRPMRLHAMHASVPCMQRRRAGGQ